MALQKAKQASALGEKVVRRVRTHEEVVLLSFFLLQSTTATATATTTASSSSSPSRQFPNDQAVPALSPRHGHVVSLVRLDHPDGGVTEFVH
jgi:hypothetical protein